MASRDPRIDAYIAESAEFARPILQRLREIVHEACPQAEEAIKWGMPSFVYRGGILCGMAAFKQHASFGFWKHAQVMGEANPRDGMGSYGKMARLPDLPPKRQLVADIKKAMRLQKDGIKTAGPRKTVAPKPAPKTPADLAAALKKNAKAHAVFAAFAPGHKREYIEWLIEAKREDTRARRLSQAIEWIAEGKQRHWKYQNG